MSVQELERRVQELPLEELARFIVWFEAYRRQVLGEFSDADDWEEQLTDEQKTELLRRVEFAKAHPEALEPWNGTTDRIRERLHRLTRSKSFRRPELKPTQRPRGTKSKNPDSDFNSSTGWMMRLR